MDAKTKGAPAGVISRCGNTTYEMDDCPTPGMVRVVRTNSDGEREFHFPAELIVEYMSAKGSHLLMKMFADLLRDSVRRT